MVPEPGPKGGGRCGSTRRLEVVSRSGSASTINAHAPQVVAEVPASDGRTSVGPLRIDQSVATDRSPTQGADRPRIGTKLFEGVAQALDRGVLSVAKRVGDQALDIELREMLLQDAQYLADRAEHVGRDDGIQDGALAVRDWDLADLVDPHLVEAPEAVGLDTDVSDGEVDNFPGAWAGALFFSTCAVWGIVIFGG